MFAVIDRIRGWYVFRLRWWYRVKRGRCPLGPPPPCPDWEEHEIRAVYERPKPPGAE